ncbi:MAG: STAS domain-containing protein [Victivallales bacterium]
MYKTEQTDGKYVFKFEGRMDTSACSVIEKEVDGQVGKAGQPVVFDLKNVDFVSSAFLRFCISAAKKTGAGKFQVTNASPQIKKVFKIAGMDQILSVQ